MSKDSKSVWSGLAVAIPTCHRNSQLDRVISSICNQSTLPEYVLVFDNSIEGVARGVGVERCKEAGVCLLYFHTGQNLGPAGAFAAAIDFAAEQPLSIEWIMCRGDDNPFAATTEVEKLYQLSVRADMQDVACIGTHGHLFDWRSFNSYPPEIDDAVDDVIEVDLVPGLGTPTYSVKMLSRLGINFDESLFFGWEEMDIGLRVCLAGGRLVIGAALDRELRSRLNISAEGGWDIVRPAPQSWRIYFSVRNRMRIAIKHREYEWAIKHAVATIKACLGAMIRRRSIVEAEARLLGLVDGTLGGTSLRAKYIPRAPNQIFSELK